MDSGTDQIKILKTGKITRGIDIIDVIDTHKLATELNFSNLGNLSNYLFIIRKKPY